MNILINEVAPMARILSHVGAGFPYEAAIVTVPGPTICDPLEGVMKNVAIGRKVNTKVGYTDCNGTKDEIPVSTSQIRPRVIR
jgi:hypothetical protein